MARLTARRGELSVRMALGAGCRRIVRQLPTEAVVLSLLGASLGVMLAWLAIDLTLPLVPQPVLPRLGGIVIDAHVMVFCLGLSFVSTLLIGFMPALRVSGAAFGEGLARGARHLWPARLTQRRREIGVRMALGADRRDVLCLVLTRAFRIVVAGVIVGLAGAAGVTRVLRTFLFGVTPTRTCNLVGMMQQPDVPRRLNAISSALIVRCRSLTALTAQAAMNRENRSCWGEPRASIMLNAWTKTLAK